MKDSKIVARTRGMLALLLLLALVLVGQSFSQTLFTIGILLVVSVVVLGFTFNNIADNAGIKKIAVTVLVTWAIVGSIFVAGILLAPILTQIGV
jgi:hypothetical protein